MKMGGFNFREILSMDPTRFSRSTRNSTSKNSTSINIAQFPPEVLAHIFELLEGRDIASAARVCKSFHQATQVDRIWQTRCLREFRVSIASGFQAQETFRMALYKKVLHKYGHLIGEWQPEITHYGGLVEVKFENEKLVGIEWLATNDSNMLRRDDLFSIGLDNDENLEILCLRGYNGPHKCQLTIKNGTSFNAKCCVPDSHRHPKGNDEEFEEWSRRNTGNNAVNDRNPFHHELLFMKFLHIKNYENSFDFRRLQLPGSPVLNPIIKPGLFQGRYGDHGREIVALTFEQDGVVAKAIKITGDPNVPYGEVTFRVDLRYSIVLNESQQRTIELLMQLPRNSTNVLPQNLPVQPFLVPSDCTEYGSLQDPPNQCKARFSGYAQVAGHGYTNASYTKGHWVVFNDDLFAFIFLELSSISLYQRVRRNS